MIHLSKSRESLVGIYTGVFLDATTRKKSLVEKFHKPGICVSYNCVLELSTTLGNNVLSHSEADLGLLQHPGWSAL